MDVPSALVYVFWHRSGGASGYEEALVRFHEALAGAAPPFLLGSAAYRVRGLPWMDGDGYEDWYVVPDFADLGRLREAAIVGPVGTAHDRAAALAVWGAAGLYGVLRGGPGLDARRVTWLAKPAGRAYGELFGALPATSWLVQRQLTLGPTPEFCVAGEIDGGLIVEREAVFRSA